MKRCSNFQMNAAFAIGATLNFLGVLVRHFWEPVGTADHVLCFIQGAAVGLLFIGLLYGSARTRPLFDRLRTMKLRLLGR